MRTSMRWGVRRSRVLTIFSALLVGTTLVLSNHLIASADGTATAGNKNCSDLIPGSLELRVNAPTDGTFSNGSFSVTIDVRTLTADDMGHPGDQTGSQVFDFDATGGTVIGVAVKGGPDTNFYDYRPAGVTSGDGLHSPVNSSNNKFYGLSHVSFCYVPGTEIDIVKSPVQSPVTIGDTFAYDITVSDVADGIAATNLTVTDELVPDGFNWQIVSQDGSACTVSDSADADAFVDNLSCSPTLADGGSYDVRVATTTNATAAHCDNTYTNTAFADADNAGPVSDDASITVACGGLKVVKTAKHADTSGATSANLAATFEITDSNGVKHEVTTDGTTGLACVDDLPTGAASVIEKTGPAGYAKDTDTESVTVTDADCPSPGAGATASFENVPLTDISWSVDSQRNGATSTVVDCKDSSGTSMTGYPRTVSDGSGSLPNLLPTDPAVTVTCTFTVDP